MFDKRVVHRLYGRGRVEYVESGRRLVGGSHAIVRFDDERCARRVLIADCELEPPKMPPLAEAVRFDPFTPLAVYGSAYTPPPRSPA